MLGEEWMEHLMDRMEKEYTSELQVRQEVRQQGGSEGEREAGGQTCLPSVRCTHAGAR